MKSRNAIDILADFLLAQAKWLTPGLKEEIKSIQKSVKNKTITDNERERIKTLVDIHLYIIGEKKL